MRVKQTQIKSKPKTKALMCALIHSKKVDTHIHRSGTCMKPHHSHLTSVNVSPNLTLNFRKYFYLKT